MRKALFTRVTIALSVLSAALVLSALFTPFATRADEFIGGYLKATDRSLAVSGAMYNTSLPTLTSGNYANLAVDINGRLILSPSSSVSLALPFAGGSSGNATGAGQSVGIEGFNSSTGQMDSFQLDASDNVKVVENAPLPAGTNAIGTVTPVASLRTTVSGSSTGAFGSTVCGTPPCTKQVVSGAGVLTSIQWNSLTDMTGLVVTCWDGTSAGTIDNMVVQFQVMSASGTWPIPAGGWKFTTGLFCSASANITSSQAFNFWTHN
jgi:hypothetical protein